MPPLFVCSCIDYRYDALVASYLAAIGFARSYYLGTNAGASLALGYEEYCQRLCVKGTCGPRELHALKQSFVANLQIALSLKPINTVYLINHQDCAAFRRFLSCSGYPDETRTRRQKDKEIAINAQVLTFAAQFVHRRFPKMTVLLGLLDANGTVADYDVRTKQWRVVYRGPGHDPHALWFGR